MCPQGEDREKKTRCKKKKEKKVIALRRGGSSRKDRSHHQPKMCRHRTGGGCKFEEDSLGEGSREKKGGAMRPHGKEKTDSRKANGNGQREKKKKRGGKEDALWDLWLGEKKEGTKEEFS